jgi:nitrite transporter NirC
MYLDDFTAAAEAAKIKAGFLGRNPTGYFIASMMAGAFIGFGTLLVFSIGGQLAGLPYTVNRLSPLNS